MRLPEISLRHQLVVRVTQQPQIAERVRAAACPRVLVVELQKRSGLAADAVFAHEAAAKAVALEHLSSRFVGDVTT